MYGDIRSIDNASRPKPTGRQILEASWQTLKEDQQLLWVPVISEAASLAAGAALFTQASSRATRSLIHIAWRSGPPACWQGSARQPSRSTSKPLW